MQIWIGVFLLSSFLVFFNYIGYALPLLVFNRMREGKTKETLTNTELPAVSFIVAAYNEEDFIEEKVSNSLAQEYPKDKIEFIFITDGSSDRTPALLQNNPNLTLLHQAQRQGKSAAINRAVLHANHEILVFSDANTLLNKDAVYRLALHYANPVTGGVAGEKKVVSIAANAVADDSGEGIYWKYESFLKKTDAAFYSVVGAAGELFSIRKNLYEPISPAIVLDDFVLSLKAAGKGYRIAYEPAAYATETPSSSIQEEQKRKIRIAAGGFQAIGVLGSLFFFWRHPKLTYLYLSHRVMRWAVSPLCLMTALASNFIIACYSNFYLYKILLAVQILFYSTAIVAAVFPALQQRLRLLKLPYYFVFMNRSVVRGFFRFIRGRQPATWEKVQRMHPLPAPIAAGVSAAE